MYFLDMPSFKNSINEIHFSLRLAAIDKDSPLERSTIRGKVGNPPGLG
jgi:hypothetical protein